MFTAAAPAAATRVPVAPEPARSWSDSSKVIFAALPPEGVPASVRSTIEPGGPIEGRRFVANIPIEHFPRFGRGHRRRRDARRAAVRLPPEHGHRGGGVRARGTGGHASGGRLDTENLQVYEEGSAAAPTTWTNAAWCIEPFGVSTTRVHPAGGVMVGLPPTPIEAPGRRSAAHRPAPHRERRRAGRECGRSPERNAMGAVGAVGVVTGAEGSLGAEVLPAASDAVTV